MNRKKLIILVLAFVVCAGLGWAIHSRMTSPPQNEPSEKKVDSGWTTPIEASQTQAPKEIPVTTVETHEKITQNAPSKEKTELAANTQQEKPVQSEIPKSESKMMKRSILPSPFKYQFSIQAGPGMVLKSPGQLTGLSSPQFSPDGNTIVFAAGKEGNRDIWLIDRSGENPLKLVSGNSDETDPSWMSDGERIIYSSNKSGNYELWMVNADGTGEKQITSDGKADKFHPRCSPIKWHNYERRNQVYTVYTILYQAENDNYSGIWLVGEDGTLPTELTPQAANKKYRHPEWSPHGLTIVYICEEDGQITFLQGWESFHWNQMIKSWHVSETGICHPQFLPNITKLTYLDPVRDKKAIWYASINSPEAKKLELPHEIKGNVDWSPDGSCIVYASESDGYDCLVVQEVYYPLHEVTNLWQYADYTQKQAVLLEKNRFVVTGKEHNLFHHLYEYYTRYDPINTGGYAVPTFITVDSTLELLHLLYDFNLRTIEQETLIPLLEKLISGCGNDLRELLKQSASPEMKEDITFLVNYINVAENLLSIPQKKENQLVEKELSLIENSDGLDRSPIFQIDMDYSQFTVRGHYTLNDSLSSYFRTMMWLGQAIFSSNNLDKTRQAFILTRMLHRNSGLLDAWNKLYSPILFLVGGADDLQVLDYQKLMDGIYTEETYNELYDKQKLDKFLALVNKEEPPKIVPQDGISFRFMPQRFTPDSYIHQQLVYDKVSTSNNPRLLPRGLDIMAVLGSERAYEILDSILDETRFENYTEQVEKLKSEFSSVSTAEWWQNIYWGWIYTLTSLLPEFGEKYPPFMRTTAWYDKSLSTSLASWTELRHDTIMYVKQGQAESGEEGEGWEPIIPPSKGYVEANPEFFRRLKKLLELSYNGLKEKNMLPKEVAAKSDKFLSIVTRLWEISGKELDNEPLSGDDYSFIRRYGSEIEYLAMLFSKQSVHSIYESEVSLIADVFTDRPNNRVLHEAVGKVREMDVIVEIEGKHQLNKGGVFTYYEFPMDGRKRLNDDEWREMLRNKTAPDLPVWTKSFIVE